MTYAASSGPDEPPGRAGAPSGSIPPRARGRTATSSGTPPGPVPVSVSTTRAPESDSMYRRRSGGRSGSSGR